MKKTKRRLFIECTSTFFNGGNSGIQRVTRNLANHSKNIDIVVAEVIPIVWTGFSFWQPRANISSKPYYLITRIKKRLAALLRRRSSKAPGRLKKLIIWCAKRCIPKLIWARKSSLPYYVLALIHTPAHFLLGRFVRFKQGDAVVLVDATWQNYSMLKALFNARKNPGIQLGVMIHDLFPLIIPEMCNEKTTRNYTNWFYRAIPNADFFITNSESTRSSLHKYLEENPTLRSQEYASASFRLGAELDLVRKSGKLSPHLQPLWNTPGKALLCIATIEPRKNHAFLLDAFDIMLQRGCDVSLILVGQVGWKTTEILDRIRSHREFEKRLIHLRNASDHDLAAAIERSACLVCPSLAEGFGLPLVEGLTQDLEVFASDIPSFREIGNEHCRFFALDSPDCLADQIETWLVETSNPRVTIARKSFSWPDWKASTREFAQQVLTLSEKCEANRIKADVLN